MTSIKSEKLVSTLYGDVEKDLLEKCKQIKLVAFDVDGVFSDGSIYLGNNQEEFKAFNTKDGYGVKAIQKCGICVAVITGRNSNIVSQRMKSLNVNFIIQGKEQKKDALNSIISQLGLSKEQVASMGDDMPDLGMFELSSVKVAVNDAHPSVINSANFITTLGGGKGAVREFCDLLLQANEQLDVQHGASV